MEINFLSITNQVVPMEVVVMIVAAALGILVFHTMRFRDRRKECTEYVNLALDFFEADHRFLTFKDEEKRYFMVNRAFLLLHGKKQEDFIGKTDGELQRKDLAETLEKMDDHVLSTGTPVEEVVYAHERVYRIRKFPVRLPGKKAGIGINAEDITEDIAYEKELARIIRRNEILISAFAKDFASSHEQLDYVLYQALELTGSDYGYIYLFDEEKKLFSLENFAVKGKVSSKRRSYKQNYRLENMGLWSQSVRTKEAHIFNREKRSARNTEEEDYFNLMTVPVILEDQVVAVVGVANNPKGYTKVDAEELSLLMIGVWNAKDRREFSLALRDMNADLLENKEKLTLILNSSADGIYGMDTKGNFTFINQSALTLLGYEKVSDFIGKNCHEMIHHKRKDGSSYPEKECRIYDAIPKGETVTCEDEVFIRKDGTAFSVQYSAHPQIRNDRIIGAVVTFSDITERKKQEEDVLYLTYHDSLTGLHNRPYLEKVYHDLEQEENYPMSVVVGDVNGLKLSNDIFGHQRGDQFLKRIAEVIKHSIREEDLVFRVGGDEFYLFLRSTREEDARVVMHRIQKAVEMEDFQGVRGSISLGLSVKTVDGLTLEEVLNDAEQNMYREKTLRAKMEGKKQLSYLISQLMSYPKERAHAENTRNYARAIGEALKLRQDELKALEDAAYLHDVGKIPTIIGKNKGEMSFYPTRKDHAVIGYRILNAFEETADIAKAVLSHHEKWNGTGYPKGLSGEEIPLLSRIIAVAEKFDRLTGISYGKPISKEEALQHLDREKGETLDPKVVNALKEAV
ncbi:diguanylate cyclase [Proteiniclasticum ruminis]|nr:diguanylate cyclase [Proteiniclasticum ruminis]